MKPQTIFAIANVLAYLQLQGCATPPEKPVAADQASVIASETPHSYDAERQLTEKNRHCQEEKRRLESALREQQKRAEESQKRAESTQKKLDALLAIDRELRTRSKNRP